MPCGTIEEVEPFLKGLMYPATKQDIMEQAKENNADYVVLETLGSMDEKTYYDRKGLVKVLKKTITKS